MEITKKVESPRHLIEFQKNYNSNSNEDMSRFDHYSLRSMKVMLNTYRSRYGDFNKGFTNDVTAKLYEMYDNIKTQ